MFHKERENKRERERERDRIPFTSFPTLTVVVNVFLSTLQVLNFQMSYSDRVFETCLGNVKGILVES